MLISISLGDGLAVHVEAEGSYSPDVAEMLAKTARETFRLAMADCTHLNTEHE